MGEHNSLLPIVGSAVGRSVCLSVCCVDAAVQELISADCSLFHRLD